MIDPANKRDAIGDIYAVDGKLVNALTEAQKEAAITVDASGLVVAPGLVDIHVHSQVHVLAPWFFHVLLNCLPNIIIDDLHTPIILWG